MDIRLALMSGIDIPIPECTLVIHQPTIKEISYLGEEEYFSGLQLLCIDKKTIALKDKNIIENYNNFQIFMTIISSKEALDKKKSVISTLNLLFPNNKVIFTPNGLTFLSGNEVAGTVDKNNFSAFQNVIKKISCFTSSGENFDPVDQNAQEIDRKIMRGRQRVSELNGTEKVSILSHYTSSLAVGLGYSLSECFSLTIYQLYDLIERFGLYINWDLDVRTRLAGGKPDSKAENWMKNIHTDN